MTPGHPYTIGNMSLQAHQMKIFILLQTLTTQPKLISIYGCFAIGWMISHERNSLVGFESSYMHFWPKIDSYLCMPKLDVLHRSITQHDGFNNLNFMGGGDISIKDTHQDLVFG